VAESSRPSCCPLPAAGAAAAALPRADAKSSFSYGSLTDAVIVNNGHTLQVALPQTFNSSVMIPVLGECCVQTVGLACSPLLLICVFGMPATNTISDCT
jgi:hypothetical protein